MSAFIEFGTVVSDVIASNDTNADQRIREARTKLYRQLPNRNMKRFPLTKIVMSNAGRPSQNPKIEWGMESHDARYVIPTYTFTDALSTAVTNTASAAKSDIYIQMAEASAQQFVKYEEVDFHVISTTDSNPGHEANVKLQVSEDPTLNGANSYIRCRTLEEDTGKALYYGNGNVATYTAYASPAAVAMPEGSSLPWNRFREVTEHYNYLQTFMAGLGLTGEELSNAQRFDENTYTRYWKQVLDYYHTQIERAIRYGVRNGPAETGTYTAITADMGAGSQSVSQYRTGGLEWMIKNLGSQVISGTPDNYIDIRQITTFQDMDFSASSWATGGYDFIKYLFLYLSQKSDSRKQWHVSSYGKLAIMNLFEGMTNVMVEPFAKNEWGFEVTRIHGLNCEVDLFQDADLSLNPAWQYNSFIIEPENLQWRTKKGRDMTVIKSLKDLKKNTVIEDGFGFRDATKEGIMMEGGLQVDNLDGMAWVVGIGRDFHA